MSRSLPDPKKPRVTIRRRPGDFSGRDTVLLQGATCCCCCCCLHWIGAAIGGTAGIVGPWIADKKDTESGVHPVARKYIMNAVGLGIAGTAAFITVAALILGNVGGGPWYLELLRMPVLAVIFLPSLAMLPVGAAALLGAAVARRKAAAIADPDQRARIAAGTGLAWRIAWRSFLGATFASGIGYLAMYVIALFLD